MPPAGLGDRRFRSCPLRHSSHRFVAPRRARFCAHHTSLSRFRPPAERAPRGWVARRSPREPLTAAGPLVGPAPAFVGTRSPSRRAAAYSARMERDDTKTLAPTEPTMHPHPSNESSHSAELRMHGHLRGHHRHCHHGGRGIVPGLVVVAWGTLLLLRELGALSSELRVMDFWPLLLVGFGLSSAIGGRKLGSRLLGLVVAVFGVALLGEKLGWLTVGVAQLWPVLVVAAGLAIVWNGLTRHRHPRTLSSEAVSADEVRRSVTMGSLKLLVDSQQFKGGSIHATMGEVQLDLRRAAFAGDEIALDLSLLMSGVEIHVPSHWRVASDVSQTMGVVEDKTDPRPDAAGVQKRLLLRGNVTMGAVTIKN